MSQQDKENPSTVKAAIIGGIFAVIAACIGGIFLILNSFINNGFIFAGAGNPNSYPTTAPVSTETQPTIFTSEAVPPAVVSNVFQGSVTGSLETNVLLNLSDNQVIIGTADKYQDVKDKELPPFAVFVIFGPIDENISLPWGGWDQWLNATPSFIESELEKNIQKTKDNHPSDWMSRGINVYRCRGSVLNCTIEIVPTN